MYKLNQTEHKNLDYSRDIVRYQPDERLLRYKRNTVGLGGFVLFVIVAGISVDGFSGGFIRGNIDHPIMVFVFYPDSMYIIFICAFK
ncbi:hypothetical protein MNBD_GAMMA21-2751 [hydrothermal vent metagenome]|uniref:Uncharacterized protein n=1 Tax=hydrothermal vent metagenome TaxID=652676 RepID=A0A3B1A5N9_9ZZZZ